MDKKEFYFTSMTLLKHSATEWSDRPRLFGREASLSTQTDPHALPQDGGSFLVQSAATLGTVPDYSSARPTSDLITPSFRLRVPAWPQVTSVLISVSSRPTGDLQQFSGSSRLRSMKWDASVAMADQDNGMRDKFNVQYCSHHQKQKKELYKFAMDGTNWSNSPRCNALMNFMVHEIWLDLV